MYAKKSLGQHFLKSEKALGSIVEAGEIQPGEIVLEIGPGQGALTERLLEKKARVWAVEKDDELFKLLENKFEKEIDSKQLTLIHQDILEFEPREFEAGEWKLIANIPYNITGAILEKFLSNDNQPSKMVLLVQKEVAERIVAKDGKESILSISVKVYGKPHYIETVKAGSFSPAPQVDSAIITVEQISKNFFNQASEKDFFKTLQAGFQSKRKKLSSNLSKIYPKEEVLKTFEALNLDENTRAEDVSLENWSEIFENLNKVGN